MDQEVTVNQADRHAPHGVIFDMDGVLVDSEEFICKAAMAMFAEHGLTVRPEDFLPFVGAGENRYIGGVAEKYDFACDIERDKRRTYDIYLDIIKGQLKPLPGVHDFVKRARSMGKRLAVASAADRRKVEGNLVELALPPESFDAIVTGDDITHNKPDPEIFLTAAERIGCDPQRCLVVEDAVNGVAAAKAAGARCLGITSTFTTEDLGRADWHAENLGQAPEEVLCWSH